MASLDEISSERFFSVKTRMFYFNHEGTASHGWRAPSDYGITRMFYFNHEGTASHGWRAPSDYGIIPLAIIDD